MSDKRQKRLASVEDSVALCIELFTDSMSQDYGKMSDALNRAARANPKDLHVGFTSIMGSILSVIAEEHGNDYAAEIAGKAEEHLHSSLRRVEKEVVPVIEKNLWRFDK